MLILEAVLARVALLFVSIFLARAAWASPSTDAELERARALFTEALGDQDAARTQVALEKFKRVAGVRDTAQVEYRIGSCLEALGQRRAALLAYDRSARLGRGESQADDVVKAANERIAALATTMGKLALEVRGTTASPAVRIDDLFITSDEAGADIVLEPGTHAVEVSAAGMTPTHATVTIESGKRETLSLTLAPALVPPRLSFTRRNVGMGLIAGAAATAVGAGIALGVREALIGSIKSDCPNNLCPESLHDSVESRVGTATALMPLAVTLGVVAAIATGIGITLVALGPVTVKASGLGRLSIEGTF